MRDDEDRVARATRHDGADVPQVDAAAARDVGREAVYPRPQSQLRQLGGHPAGGASRRGRARRAVGVERHEVLGQPVRVHVVERRLERRSDRWQRRRPRHREGRGEHRYGEDDERDAVETAAERTLHGAGPRTPSERVVLGGRVGNGAAIVGRSRSSAHVEPRHHPPGRRRGSRAEALGLSARARRLPRGSGTGRRRGPTAIRRARGRPRRPRPHAAQARRPRGLQADSRREHTCRSSCSPPATTRWTRCSASSSARTTTSRSRSRSASSVAG